MYRQRLTAVAAAGCLVLMWAIVVTERQGHPKYRIDLLELMFRPSKMEDLLAADVPMELYPSFACHVYEELRSFAPKVQLILPVKWRKYVSNKIDETVRKR